MKKLEELGVSPSPWSLNVETCTVVDAKGRPVLDNEYGVASMEDADMNFFIASSSLYDALYDMVKVFGHHALFKDEAAAVAKAKAALAKAAGEREVAG